MQPGDVKETFSDCRELEKCRIKFNQHSMNMELKSLSLGINDFIISNMNK